MKVCIIGTLVRTHTQYLNDDEPRFKLRRPHHEKHTQNDDLNYDA